MVNIDFQNYAQKIISRLPNEPYITFNHILSSNVIEEPYTNFINNELQQELKEFMCILENISFINLNSESHRKIVNKFIDELFQNIEFNQNRLQSFIISALKLRYNFLSKPNSTLLFFLFGDSLQKPKSEVLFKLSYFSDYKNILSRITVSIENNPKESLSVYEFNSLFNNIIFEYFNTASVEELLEFFNPIYEFFETYNEGDSIPSADLFAELFDDIGLNHFSQLVQNYCATNNLQKIEKDTLEELLLHFSTAYKNLIITSQSRIPSPLSFNRINLSHLETFIFDLPKEVPKIEEDLLARTIISESNVVAKNEEIDEIKKLLSELDKKSEFESDKLEPFVIEQEPNNFPTPILNSEILAKDKEFNQVETSVLENEENQNLEIEEIGGNQDNEISNESAIPETQPDKTIYSSEPEELENNNNFGIEPKIENKKFRNFNELFDEEKRKQFINELFYSIEEEYDKLIKNIDNSDSFETAMEYVNACFNELDIFTEMPIAKEFVEFVRQKFS